MSTVLGWICAGTSCKESIVRGLLAKAWRPPTVRGYSRGWRTIKQHELDVDTRANPTDIPPSAVVAHYFETVKPKAGPASNLNVAMGWVDKAKRLPDQTLLRLVVRAHGLRRPKRPRYDRVIDFLPCMAAVVALSAKAADTSGSQRARLTAARDAYIALQALSMRRGSDTARIYFDDRCIQYSTAPCNGSTVRTAEHVRVELHLWDRLKRSGLCTVGRAPTQVYRLYVRTRSYMPKTSAKKQLLYGIFQRCYVFHEELHLCMARVLFRYYQLTAEIKRAPILMADYIRGKARGFLMIKDDRGNNPRRALPFVIWITGGGKWFMPASIQKRVETVLLETARKTEPDRVINPHIIRGTAASYLIACGVDTQMVKLAGDWSLSGGTAFEQHYQHLADCPVDPRMLQGTPIMSVLPLTFVLSQRETLLMREPGYDSRGEALSPQLQQVMQGLPAYLNFWLHPTSSVGGNITQTDVV